MTLPQGGFRSSRPPRRRRAVVAGLFVLALLLAWGWFVTSLETGEGEAAAGGGETEAQKAEAPAKTAAPQQEAAGASAYATGEDGQAPDGDPAATGDGYAPPDGTPVSDDAGSPGASSAAHEGHSHPEGATNEPGVYDPLGTGAKPGDLTPTDESRVRFAASSFVAAAYGYTGDDKEAYLAGVYRAALSPDFARSEGAEEVSRYAAQVEETGTRSAAILTTFDIEKTEPESVKGLAYFQTGEAYEGTALKGKKLSYRQELTLVRVGAAWKVQQGGKVEETK